MDGSVGHPDRPLSSRIHCATHPAGQRRVRQRNQPLVPIHLPRRHRGPGHRDASRRPSCWRPQRRATLRLRRLGVGRRMQRNHLVLCHRHHRRVLSWLVPLAQDVHRGRRVRQFDLLGPIHLGGRRGSTCVVSPLDDLNVACDAVVTPWTVDELDVTDNATPEDDLLLEFLGETKKGTTAHGPRRSATV